MLHAHAGLLSRNYIEKYTCFVYERIFDNTVINVITKNQLKQIILQNR